MGAMHPDSRSGVDVELAVDHHSISGVDGDNWRQRCVVIDLESFTRCRLYLEALVTPRLHRVVEHRRVEGHLGAAPAVDHVAVEGLVVSDIPAAARTQGKEHGQQGSDTHHSARASSSVRRPSYSALPAPGPSAFTSSTWTEHAERVTIGR